MSRIGKLPVIIPDGVEVTIDGQKVIAKGPMGTEEVVVREEIAIKKEDNQIVLTRTNDERKTRALHGLSRTLVNNAIIGVKDGFTKSLTVNGVGYKLAKQGNKLVMNLGMSHPVEIVEEKGITLEIPDNNTILVKGANKEQVGAVAAKIRATRPMEPYHGYGIHYTSEQVILKPGKAAGKKK